MSVVNTMINIAVLYGALSGGTVVQHHSYDTLNNGVF